jgi:hypothetical protein
MNSEGCVRSNRHELFGKLRVLSRGVFQFWLRSTVSDASHKLHGRHISSVVLGNRHFIWQLFANRAKELLEIWNP